MTPNPAQRILLALLTRSPNGTTRGPNGRQVRLSTASALETRGLAVLRFDTSREEGSAWSVQITEAGRVAILGPAAPAVERCSRCDGTGKDPEVNNCVCDCCNGTGKE